MSDEFFIEKRDDNRFSVSKPNAGRASAIADTQKQAIEMAKDLNPNATIHVARVRNIGPGPDKFRKIK